MLKVNLATAGTWLSAGVKIFPALADGSKRPAVKSWQSWSPPADKPLEPWKHTAKLVALPCGVNKLVVIDCDIKAGVDGVGSFYSLCESLHIDLTHVPVIRTPSGGLHFYFRASPSGRVTNRTGGLPRGIDVRGNGGLVIAAGSQTTSGQCYEPLNYPLPILADLVGKGEGTVGLPELPAALENIILSGVTPLAGAAITAGDELGAGIRSPWSLPSALANIAHAPEGKRNETLNKEAFVAARKVAQGQLAAQEARDQLAFAARRAGLAEFEITQTLSSAFNAGAVVPTPAPVRVTSVGKITASLAEAKRALKTLGIEARQNLFCDEVVLSGALPPDYHGCLKENALTWIRDEVLERCGFDPKDDYLLSAVKAVAERNRFNPVVEWLDSLKWDGVKRLNGWLPRVAHCESTDLNNGAGISLILGMVARAIYPGTKFDLCVVLEGRQGSGKSSLAKTLASEKFFTDAPGILAMDPKARGEILAGAWVAELGELSGLSKSESEAVKASLAQTHDHYRAAYERVAKKRPRTCIFIGTTNSQSYLPDTTGNRRFLPVACGEVIDLALLHREREQIFAEARDFIGRLVAEARRRGFKVVEAHPLPDAIAAVVGLRPHLWPTAAAAAENRRVVDHGEEVLSKIVKQRIASARYERQPSGAIFLASLELQTQLRIELGVNPNSRQVAHWMSKAGWKPARHGRGADQVRGYELDNA